MYLCELVDIYNALRSERGYKLAHDNKKSLDIINKDTIPTVKLIDHIEYFVEKEITENYIKYIFRIKNPFIFVRNIGDTELNRLLKVNIGILHMNDNIFIFNDRNLSDFKNSLKGIDNYEQLIMILKMQ